MISALRAPSITSASCTGLPAVSAGPLAARTLPFNSNSPETTLFGHDDALSESELTALPTLSSPLLLMPKSNTRCQQGPPLQLSQAITVTLLQREITPLGMLTKS